jgi:hypothetical protein
MNIIAQGIIFIVLYAIVVAVIGLSFLEGLIHHIIPENKVTDFLERMFVPFLFISSLLVTIPLYQWLQLWIVSLL